MPERDFAAGEILPCLIADAWADLNNCEHGQGDALLYEIEVRRLIEAGIEAGKIKCRGGHPKYAPAPAGVAFEDCYFEWEEIRAWIKEYDGESWPLVPPWMATTESASPAVTAAEATTNSTIRHSLKSRWNALDTAIEKAIEQAANDKTADVLLALRSIALDEVPPFTGEIEGGTLFYTNDKGERVPLTRDGLDGRLRRRRKAS